MAKKGKTRKQKKLADLRRNKAILDTPRTVSEKKISAPIIEKYSLKQLDLNSENQAKNSPVKESNNIKTPKTIATAEYIYLRKDLQKTIYLTGFIAIAEIFVRLFFKGI